MSIVLRNYIKFINMFFQKIKIFELNLRFRDGKIYAYPTIMWRKLILHPINIVLFEPQIPQNTGNIARTCAATGASLHLIRPLGFAIDSAKLKRAGLDYWDSLDIRYYDGLDDFFAGNPDAQFYCFTAKAPHAYTEIAYPLPVYLFFGKETTGLPEDFLRRHPDRCVRIPIREGQRCLNLSNAAAVGVFEVLRQHGFPGQLCASDRLTSSEQAEP